MNTVMSKEVEVMDLIRIRRDTGLISLPLSTAFQVGVGTEGLLKGLPRPSSQWGKYPWAWKNVGAQSVQVQYMRYHRHERRDGLRGRCECCRRREGDGYRRENDGKWVVVELQACHMDWQPDNLHWNNIRALCPGCHRAWDKVHQEASSALTMAGERTLTWARYCSKLGYVCSEITKHGLIRVSPASVDFLVAACLQAGPISRDELPACLGRSAPMLILAITTTELPAVLAASLTRLGMRRVDATGEPLVAHTRGQVRLSVPRLHLDSSVTKTPHCAWTAARYIVQRSV